jgi:hypothetical protein
MRDLAMLRRAAAEFFIEGFMAAEVARIVANTPPENQEAALKSLMAPRTVPEGGFIWINYLIWLERVLDLVDVPLTAVEVEALMVLKRERIRFQNEHPPCPHCGMPNEAHALRCRECMGEIGN